MTDKIPPVFTADEWKRIQRGEAGVPGIGVAFDHPHEAIAMCNRILPDSDPRKITRAWVADIREGVGGIWSACQDHCVGGTCECGDAALRLDHIADALESYLPPESTDASQA